MFNKELKEQYIIDNESRNLAIRQVIPMFEHISLFEEKLNKDLSNFTVAEIIDFYKVYCTSSLESLMIMNSQFKLYTAYCLSRNLIVDCQNHYAEIDQPTLDSCVNYGLAKAKIISKDTLLEFVSLLQNPSDRFLLLAIFEGICGEEMCELVDIAFTDFFEDQVRLCTGRVLTISKLLRHYAEISSEEYVYISFDNGLKVRELPYAADDVKIIKRLYNADAEAASYIKRQRIYSKLMRIKKYLGSASIGAKQLMESGRIDTIKRLMKEDNISLEDCIKKYKSVLEYRYGKITSISRYKLKYGEFFEEE